MGMKYVTESMSAHQQTCTLAIDGMKMQQNLQYLKSDKITGFEELEDGQRTPNIASEMVVVMAQGIDHHWKQVSYITSS